MAQFVEIRPDKKVVEYIDLDRVFRVTIEDVPGAEAAGDIPREPQTRVTVCMPNQSEVVLSGQGAKDFLDGFEAYVKRNTSS